MAHYVDIETSAEALEEEWELTQAVEALAVQAATSVWDEIMSDIRETLHTCRTWLEGTFPILCVYQEERDVLIEHLTALGIFALLTALAFLSLVPFQRRRKPSNGLTSSSSMPLSSSSRTNLLLTSRRTQSYLGSRHQGGGSAFAGKRRGKRHVAASLKECLSDTDSPRAREDQTDLRNQRGSTHSSATPTGGGGMWEEETNEERFAAQYPELVDDAAYARLLLPPTCRRVEASVAKAAKRSSRKKTGKAKEDDADGDESSPKQLAQQPQPLAPEARDNPALRLQMYARHFWGFLRSLATLDYAQAAWTVVQGLRGIWMSRISPKRGGETTKDKSSPSAPATENPATAETEFSSKNETALDCSSLETKERDDADDTSEVDTTDDKVSGPQHVKCATPTFSLDDNVEVAAVPASETIESALSFEETKQEDDHSQTPNHLVLLNNASTESPGPFLPQDFSNKPLGREVSEGSSVYHDTEEETPPTILRSSGLIRPRFNSTSSTSSALAAKHKDALRNYRMSSNGSIPQSTSQLQMGEVPSTPTVASTASSVVPHMSSPKMAASSQERPMSPPPESPFRRGVRYFFEAAHNAESMQKMSVEIPVPDKHGYILGDEFLPSRQHTPLLVFVNSRSGPQQGQLLITQLERLLNPIQIWDLANGGPEPVLESFCVFTRLRILVCGGDGSVSWIVGALERLNLSRKWPPIAILPLGTGNDLARVMGWGGGYNNESLIGILEQVSESYTSLLDRWEMTIEDSNKKTKEVKTFFNYLGVGADAEAALQVHYLRESRPDWFFSRLVNKAWYGVFGAEDILKNTNTVLRKDIVLYADGVEVPLPNDSQGIIILNIDSYAGGIPIWAHGWKPTRQPPLENVRRSASLHELRSSGFPLRRSNSAGDCLDSSDDLLGLLTDEERYERVTTSDMPTSCQDGMLEVVSIRSLFHLGQIRVGLSNAQRVCQCRHVKIVTRKKVAFQIDGEPWRQDECVLQIRRKADPVVMLHRSADDGAETEVSKLLEWAEERQLIDGTAHGILRKEFSRRIESKMRRRQSAASNTVLHNLSRAIGSSGALQHQNHQSSGTSNLSPGVNGQSRSNTPSQPYKYGWHGGIAF